MKKPKPDPKANDRLATLHAQGLDVAGIAERDGTPLVQWRKPPTEAERALANSLLPGARHDA